MENTIHHLAILSLFAPLLGAIIAGFFGSKVGRTGAHTITITGVAISLICSIWMFGVLLINGVDEVHIHFYLWGDSGRFAFNLGGLIDRLTLVMMVTVNFISLLVHIYSIGYMEEDPGYQRFFSYMSIFTFGMLSLVMADNFLMLFFGWEAVGVVSYFLIGFWFNKESAAAGSLKAFLVNRVGDLGFLLGIAMILYYCGSLHYTEVFEKIPSLTNTLITLIPGHPWHVTTVICLLLFTGAMAKSAQIPLHVWLPESMEGPTPISALIHAATMVTAGVYMVARMAPIYNYSPTSLSVVMLFGATGALLLGALAIVENDIKRIIAYSTMSQLGYMMAANGAAAYGAGIFHLVTHACFKALLFLGAGSVIIAMHHEQDIRKMGNLRQYMPLTFATYFIGTIALVAIPPTSGFFSKDAIIEAVELTNIPGHEIAYVFLLLGAYVTALYSFRSLFMTFYGKENMAPEVKKHIKESSMVVTLPLVILAIPSIILGAVMVTPAIFTRHGLLGTSIPYLPEYNVLKTMAFEFNGLLPHTLHGILSLPFCFAMAGIFTAWYCYILKPGLPQKIGDKLSYIRTALINRYGIDDFNDWIFVRGTRSLSQFLFKFADLMVIDGIVNGAGQGVKRIAALARKVQSGYLYHYAFAMMIGLFVILSWMLLT